jgi:RHS repeat-associated protein
VDPATTPRVQYAHWQGAGNTSRLTSITYPDGYQLNYTYSGLDSAVSRPTSLSGQRANSTSVVTLEVFKYLGAGTVIERSRPEVNVTLSMVNFSNATGDAGDKYTGLDRFGRIVDQRWTKGTTATSPVLDRYGHTYDRNSNRLSRSNALAAAFSETYTYDALNQLSSFSRSGGATTSQQWQFDALGNWTTVTTNGVAEARTANAQNELTQVGGSSLAYSPTGNLTTDAQGRTLAYDAWNRLVSVADTSGTEVARYGYDGLNRRIVEQVGTLASPAAATAAIRDVYYSQDWQALEERVRTLPTQVAATADTRFIWSPVYVDAMIARDRNVDNNATTGTGGLEQRVYAIQDANWNTTAIIAATGVPGVATGAVINRFAYTPYGESQSLTASWATPPAGSTPAVPWAHLFQGLEFTDVTGLAYVRHRDYSATLGRFIEMDPIGFNAGDNNWYRFVANGPTGSTDPSGLDRYRLGGKHPGDHSQVCVDLYDDQGKPTGKQYCCGLEAEGGSGGSSSSGSSGSADGSTWGTTVSVCAAMLGFWFHPAKILCFETTLTPTQQANQRVVAAREEDEALLQQLRNDRGSDTVWNGAVSNCHQYALRRLYVGKR